MQGECRPHEGAVWLDTEKCYKNDKHRIVDAAGDNNPSGYRGYQGYQSYRQHRNENKMMRLEANMLAKDTRYR